jgi:hypothetical protein
VPTLNPRFARWLLWCSLAVHVPITAVAIRNAPLPGFDFDNFYNIATKPGRPYRDFQVEFPVATVETFRTLAPIAGNRARFGVWLVMFSFAADLAITGALAWGWGIPAAAGYALVVIPLLDLFLLRTDLWSTAIATAAVAAWQRRRPMLTAAGIAAGAAFKLWPLVFLPLLLIASGARRRWTPIAVAIAGGALVLGGWLLVAGPSGLLQVITFRGARGWEIESTVGGVWMLIDQSSKRIEAGAWRIGTTSGPISILLFILGGLPALWLVWRGARTGHLGAGWAGGVSALLVMSALLSPQYSAWIAPASGVAWVEGDRRIAVLIGIAVFLSNLIWKSFNPLVHGAIVPVLIIIARNILLAVIAVDAARLISGTAPVRDTSRTPHKMKEIRLQR